MTDATEYFRRNTEMNLDFMRRLIASGEGIISETSLDGLRKMVTVYERDLAKIDAGDMRAEWSAP